MSKIAELDQKEVDQVITAMACRKPNVWSLLRLNGFTYQNGMWHAFEWGVRIKAYGPYPDQRQRWSKSEYYRHGSQAEPGAKPITTFKDFASAELHPLGGSHREISRQAVAPGGAPSTGNGRRRAKRGRGGGGGGGGGGRGGGRGRGGSRGWSRWTESEDDTLREYKRQHRHDWDGVEEVMRGRTYQSIEKHWRLLRSSEYGESPAPPSEDEDEDEDDEEDEDDSEDDEDDEEGEESHGAQDGVSFAADNLELAQAQNAQAVLDGNDPSLGFRPFPVHEPRCDSDVARRNPNRLRAERASFFAEQEEAEAGKNSDDDEDGEGDDEEEDEEYRPRAFKRQKARRRSTGAVAGKPASNKDLIIECLLARPNQTPREIAEYLERAHGRTVSKDTLRAKLADSTRHLGKDWTRYRSRELDEWTYQLTPAAVAAARSAAATKELGGAVGTVADGSGRGSDEAAHGINARPPPTNAVRSAAGPSCAAPALAPAASPHRTRCEAAPGDGMEAFVASAIDALSAQEQPGLADVVNEKEQMVRGLQKELGQLETSLNGQPSVEEYEQVRETLKVEIQRALDANDLEERFTGPWTLLRMHNRRHQVHAELQDAMSELRELVTREQRQDAHNNAINKKKREILELHDAYEAARLALVEKLESV